MGVKFKYKPPETDSGALRTPVTFYKLIPSPGPEPGEEVEDELHKCFAEIYSPSMKDMEIMNTVGAKTAITLRIRDPGTDYMPTTKHFLIADDYRFKGKVFNIIHVAPDIANNRFIKIIGEYKE